VGALLSKDFHHKMRVWFLDETESICPNCSNGCNIKVGTARREVYRFLPRRNDPVNETWMCDTGRLGYRFVNENRLRLPTVGRGTTAAARPFEDAIDEAARRLGSAARADGASVGAIVSAHLTNEELFVLGRVVAGGLRTAQHDVVVRLGDADDFLIKAEKAANARGARDLGLAAGGRAGALDLAGIRAAIEAGKIRALLVTGTDVWDAWGGTPEIFERLETLIVVTANAHPLTTLADVVLPGLTFAEKDGTFTNHAGRVQRIHRAVDPGEQPSDGDLFLALGRRLGMEIPPGPFDPGAVFGEITRAVPRYATLGWNAIGPLGAVTAEA
jgi:NADH-quinone oxidoreductase subunit G